MEVFGLDLMIRFSEQEFSISLIHYFPELFWKQALPYMTHRQNADHGCTH